jgi:uncharacterized spore protein YtfJ
MSLATGTTIVALGEEGRKEERSRGVGVGVGVGVGGEVVVVVVVVVGEREVICFGLYVCLKNILF